MAYQLHKLTGSDAWDESMLREKIDRLLRIEAPRMRRLWAYYRNTMSACGVDPGDSGSGRPYRQAQEWGLPSRITGARSGAGEPFIAEAVEGVARKEVVIENDIGWRIETLVDYLFGKPIVINSAAPDPDRRALIAELLRQVLSHNGGITFLQQMALYGAVYGFVDVLVKLEPPDDSADAPPPAAPAGGTGVGGCATQELGRPVVTDSADDSPSGIVATPGDPLTSRTPASGEDDLATKAPGASHPSPADEMSRLARRVRLEIVEPARALPLLSTEDYRCVEAYAQVCELDRQRSTQPYRKQRLLDRLRQRLSLSGWNDSLEARDGKALLVEIIAPDRWQKYEDEHLVAEGNNSLGEIPLVHVQDVPVAQQYAGASEVEALIPMQDELNTRLSDRGYRITMQSFKMYLGKGIEGFIEQPVAPGRMWMTDNEQAEVIEFGGDGRTFSEDNHIIGLRDAMDKISGVTPIAAGIVRSRIGRLTSAAALRVTMLALLAKTERKRTAYGPAIGRICELALAWLDKAGLFRTSPEERRIEIHWPSPIPVNEADRLREARMKMRLGVPQEIVLRELGYPVPSREPAD